MNATSLTYTNKWEDILADDSDVLFLEGPSQVSKTTLSSVKIIKECFASPLGQTLFYLVGESTPTLYRNFVEPETGITSLFPYITDYVAGGGKGGQRIDVQVYYDGKLEVKHIFFLGYSNKTAAKKVLGGKPYMIFADEFNKAHDQFVKEVITRITAVGTKLIATSNGDDPDLLMYQYLNACRPTNKYEIDVPMQTLEQMHGVNKKIGWTYYFFRLEDRPLATSEWIEKMYGMHPKGSFEYNSKVLGIRAVTDGILYGHLLNKYHDVSMKDINIGAIKDVLCGIDVGSGGENTNKKRAKTVFVLTGYSTRYQRAIVLDGYISKEIGHTETIQELNNFLQQWWLMFMGRMNGIYIDNAEPALISTTAKDIGYQIGVKGSVKLNKIVTSKSRVTVKEQMIHHNRLLFADTDGAQMIKRYLSKVKGINGVTIDENEIWNDINDALDYSMTPRYNKLQRG